MISNIKKLILFIGLLVLLAACGSEIPVTVNPPEESVGEQAVEPVEPESGAPVEPESVEPVESDPIESDPIEEVAQEPAAEMLEGIVAVLDISSYETFSKALADQVAAGDGNGIDGTFRNSGVVIDEAQNAYYAVNGVHPVNRGDYTSYYPKSIVMASLEDDSIIRAYSFDGVFGHEVDMEALTYAEDKQYLYIGDEYNFIYEMSLSSGEIIREWDLADIGLRVGVDKGIEALTYASSTGYFYAGIQDLGSIIILDLGLTSGGTITKIDEFRLPQGWSPSGLFAHPDGSLYVVAMSGGGPDGGQGIFRYRTDGSLLCEVTIPRELGMTRPDGIYISSDDAYVYIVDSQGPLFGGYSLYKIAWTNPCGG